MLLGGVGRVLLQETEGHNDNCEKEGGEVRPGLLKRSRVSIARIVWGGRTKKMTLRREEILPFFNTSDFVAVLSGGFGLVH